MSKTRPEADRGPAGHLPPWMLERIAFEPAGVEPEARTHASGCAACASALAELGEAQRRFLAARPSGPFADAVGERARGATGRGTSRWLGLAERWRWALAPVAVAAAALLVLQIRGAPGPEGETRLKGAVAALTIFVARETPEARPLERGAPLRPGDVVRFGVVAPGYRHAVVAGVDAGGRYSRYVPAEPAASVPLDGTGALRILPGAVELDRTTGREWFVLVVSRAPIPEARVREALLASWRARRDDRLGPIELDAAVSVVAVAKAER